MPFRLRGFRLRCTELEVPVNRHHEQGQIDSIPLSDLSKTDVLADFL